MDSKQKESFVESEMVLNDGFGLVNYLIEKIDYEEFVLLLVEDLNAEVV